MIFIFQKFQTIEMKKSSSSSINLVYIEMINRNEIKFKNKFNNFFI